MTDGFTPLRQKREAFCLYLANGYGVSSAYSSAGYSYKSREHLSKNAGSLAANAAIIARVDWLKERPDEAAKLLRGWIAQRNEQDAQSRSKALTEAVAKRQAVTAQRAVPTPPQAPVCNADNASLLELLHFCQSEAKAVYERAKLEHADAMIIKNALGSHRDFTVSLQKYRAEAKQAGSNPASAGGNVSALDVYANICSGLGEAPPALSGVDDPVFATVEEVETEHDETELKYNVSQTLNEYDLLISASARPDMRVQLQLLEVLGKSTQRLITLQAQQRGQNKGRERPQSTSFIINPSVILRWASENEILR